MSFIDDVRIRSGIRGNWYSRLDEAQMVAYVEVEEEEVAIPFRFKLCRTCEGRGSHVNPSIDANGISEEEMSTWDDEEVERYFSGGYDVVCAECSGRRVTPVPETSGLNQRQRDALTAVEEAQQGAYDDYRTYCRESGIY